MNRSSPISEPAKLATFVTILVTLFFFVAPKAYGQQEVAPAWYDPWAMPNKVVKQVEKPQGGIYQTKPRTRIASSLPNPKKGRRKSSAERRKSFVATARSPKE